MAFTHLSAMGKSQLANLHLPLRLSLWSATRSSRPMLLRLAGSGPEGNGGAGAGRRGALVYATKYDFQGCQLVKVLEEAR